VSNSESEQPELEENPRNIFERFIILLEQADNVHNSYCEHKIEFCIEGDWRSHFALIPLTQDGENVEIGACVQSLHSEHTQDAGLLPGMLLVSINDESVENSTFDVILALLDKPNVLLVFKETFEEVKEDIKFFDGLRDRAEGHSQFGKTGNSCAGGGQSVDSTTAVREIVKINVDNTESMFAPKLDKSVTATCSSASGKSIADLNSCNPGSLRHSHVKKKSDLVFRTADQTPRCPIHPVVELWPRLLMSDEYMVVFESRPLGVRVRKDWEGKNAVVWAIEGQHAKAAGIERGSMVYSVNEESVYGWQHLDIVDKLRNATLPLKIIFWRTFVIAD